LTAKIDEPLSGKQRYIKRRASRQPVRAGKQNPVLRVIVCIGGLIGFAAAVVGFAAAAVTFWPRLTIEPAGPVERLLVILNGIGFGSTKAFFRL
jgi:hypothetical protein